MRLFIAVEPEWAIKQKLGEFIAATRSRAPAAKWVDSLLLHFTVKFLGEVEPNKVAEIERLMRQVSAGQAPFIISLGKLGVFPNPQKPAVLWVGVDRGRAELVSLASAVDQILSPLGFAPEKKPYFPHLTLARFKTLPAEGVQSLLSCQVPSYGELINISEMILLESRLTPKGPIYTPLAKFPFDRKGQARYN